jgi:phosphate transport system substrate-binding protein
VLIALLSATLFLFACSSKNPNGAEASSGVKLQGAGASFPAPLYSKWFKSFGSTRKNVVVDYQSVGSGSGVKSVIDKTVDFGASDAAMTDDEMGRVPGGVQLIPMTAGSIVIAYNLPDVKDLKLSRKAYSGIFLGKIKKWNDPEIAKANPGVTLPDKPINVVVRADSSGTSFVFSKHLTAISPEFEKAVGTNKMPNWPVGTKSKGNEGVTGSIMTTPGRLGTSSMAMRKARTFPLLSSRTRPGSILLQLLPPDKQLSRQQNCPRT